MRGVPEYEWKMVTAWPPSYPVVGELAEQIAREIEEMSGGRIRISVYAGGELVPALEVFDAVSSGAVEMGHSASYYWAGKSAAAQFFTSVPFGMVQQQLDAWMYYGNGLALWNQVYADFGLTVFPAGHTGTQMGGWFNRRVSSAADFRGLKMRMTGLGGKVITELGAATVLVPGAELYPALERGVIDALEWIGPFHDRKMGFYEIARYYMFPGWQEPDALCECMINTKAYERLPRDLQLIVRAAIDRASNLVGPDMEMRNAESLEWLRANTSVEFLRYTDGTLAELLEVTRDVLSSLAAKDALCGRVYADYSAFFRRAEQWTALAEKSIFSLPKNLASA